jgi:predicted lactoylglutathione lyase
VTAPNVQQAVPFFHVTDIQNSLRFYVDGLGFKMNKSWKPEGKIRWCSLQLGATEIMLQTFRTEGPHANVPATKLGLGVSITFVCNDALAIYRDFKSRGIDASRPFVGNAMWETHVTDPDGYQLYFESATDVPEGTELSEER